MGVLITDSISLLVIGLFICSISSWFSLGSLYLRICSFPPGCPFYWSIFVWRTLVLPGVNLAALVFREGQLCLLSPGGSCPVCSVHYLDAAGLAFGLKPDSEHHMGFVLQHISGNHAGDWKLIPRYSRDSLYTRISSPCAQHSRLCYLNTGMGRGLKLCYR